MSRTLVISAAIATMLGAIASGAEHGSFPPDETIEFEGRKWMRYSNSHVDIEEFQGKTALYVQGDRRNASVYLSGVEFHDGTIEVDIAAPARFAPGIGFRGLDKGQWRNRIMFSRRRGKDGDRREVVEQVVVTRRTGTVLLLNTRRPAFPSTREGHLGHVWFHVKVVVQGDSVSVYLNGGKKPDVTIGGLFDANEKGELGFCGGHLYFANFRYTSADKVAPTVTERQG